MTYNKPKFAQRLKALREEKCLKQEELAKIFNISRASIGKYENGQIDLNTELLVKYSEFFDVSIDYILGRTNIPDIVIKKGNDLPIELQGVIDSVEQVKDAGLSYDDIREILEAQAKIAKRNKKNEK